MDPLERSSTAPPPKTRTEVPDRASAAPGAPPAAAVPEPAAESAEMGRIARLARLELSPRSRKVLRVLGYVGFYAFALLIFAYLTFPYERLRDRIVQEFNQRQTGPDAMRLELDELGSYWLSGIEAEGIRLISPPKQPATTGFAPPTTPATPPKPSVLTIDSAHVRVGLLGLLIGSVRLGFGADAFGGTVSGSTSDSDATRRVDVTLSDLSLAQAPMLADAVGLPLAGELNGEVEFLLPEGKLSKADGLIELTMTGLTVGDGKAKIRDTIALPQIDAGELVLVGEATAGQLKITRFSGSGPDLEVAAEGGVRLRDPLTLSHPNLTARFRFTDRYTGKNEMTRGLFGAPGSSVPGLFDLDPKNKRAKRPDGFYGWRVSGTLGSPTFLPNPGGAAASPSVKTPR